MEFKYPAGATSLDQDEISGLIPLHITNQKQLNEWEAANILKATSWVSTTPEIKNFLTIHFLKKLHQQMFNDTWKWAGTFRKTEKNIGVTPAKITTELKKLLDDVLYQIVNSSYPIDEIAYRFHHRLVAIHPFPNGNGRYARIMTDILLIQTGQQKFTWGNKTLGSDVLARRQYINALRNADKHDFTSLAIFVRS